MPRSKRLDNNELFYEIYPSNGNVIENEFCKKFREV